MAKDPAFLFYSQDFIVGIQTMDWEERGKYITLLAQMHQQGRLTEKTIRFLVGSVSDSLKEKFIVDNDGRWYNQRLEEEIEKRRNFVESRRLNGAKGGRPAKPTGKPIGKAKDNLPENDNEDGIEKVKEWVGKKSEAIDMLCKNNKVTLVAVRAEFDAMCKYYRAHTDKPFPKGKPYDVMDYWLNNSKKFKSNGSTGEQSTKTLPQAKQL